MHAYVFLFIIRFFKKIHLNLHIYLLFIKKNYPKRTTSVFQNIKGKLKKIENMCHGHSNPVPPIAVS